MGSTERSRPEERISPGEVLRVIKALLGPDYRQLYTLAVLAVVSAALEVALLYIVGRIGVSLIEGPGPIDLGLGPVAAQPLTFRQLLLVTALILAALAVMAVVVANRFGRISRTALSGTRRRLAQAYLRSHWADRTGDPDGHLQAMLADYTLRAERLLFQVSTVAVSACSLVIVGLAMVLIAPLASAVGLGILLALAALLRPLGDRIKHSGQAFAHADKSFATDAAQTARMGQEIAAFRVQESVLDAMEDRITRTGAQMQRLRRLQRLIPTLYLLGALAAILLVVGLLTELDPTFLTDAGPVFILLIRALGYTRQGQAAMQSMNELVPYAVRLDDEFGRLNARPIPPGTVSKDSFSTLRFRQVSFSYTAQPVLAGVDFELAAGESVGVVGPSGGGKSTLVQLLLGLRFPLGGTIEVDDLELREIDPDCWAAIVGFVPQENRLIRGTVRDNVRFYRDSFTDEQVEEAVKSAHLHDEVLALDDGYETELGPGATDLSVGQRQRLGIARAFLGKPQLLILDEPTSALDSRSEDLIRSSLQERRGTMSLVIVAHRPATLQICDRVLSVRDGKVTEQTTTPVSEELG